MDIPQAVCAGTAARVACLRSQLHPLEKAAQTASASQSRRGLGWQCQLVLSGEMYSIIELTLFSFSNGTDDDAVVRARGAGQPVL